MGKNNVALGHRSILGAILQSSIQNLCAVSTFSLSSLLLELECLLIKSITVGATDSVHSSSICVNFNCNSIQKLI